MKIRKIPLMWHQLAHDQILPTFLSNINVDIEQFRETFAVVMFIIMQFVLKNSCDARK